MKKPKLSQEEFEEMREYTHSELVEMFTEAIEQMAVRGIIGPRERVEYLENISKWLREEMEN